MSPASPLRSRWLPRIVRAVALGVGIYALLATLPMILLRLNGIGAADRAGAAAIEREIDNEPAYRDASGNRINRADFDQLTGYQRAQATGITSHAQCKDAFQHLVKLGCERYVSEHKAMPAKVKQGDWGSGKTTAQCLTEVNAYWSALIQDLEEKGETHAADSWRGRHWAPERAECRNYDNVRVGTAVHEPTARLDALLARLDAGATATAADHQQVQADMQLASSFPDAAQRKPFFDKADRFFRLAGGAELPRPDKTMLTLGCEDINARLAGLRQADERDGAEQRALKQGDRVSNGARWAALNQMRINRLFEWKVLIDGAQAAGCAAAEAPAAAASVPIGAK